MPRTKSTGTAKQNRKGTVHQNVTVLPGADSVAPEVLDKVARNVRSSEQVNDIRTTEQNQNSIAPSAPKRHKPGPDPLKYGCEYAEPGDNTRYLRMARVAMNLPPIDISDPKQVERRLNEYFDFCEANDRKPSLVSMANWLGVARETLTTWKNGTYRAETHSPLIKSAIGLMEELWVDYMQTGKINPASGIFLAKNFFQYKNVQDVVVTPNNPLQNMDAETARQRLIESVPEADD